MSQIKEVQLVPYSASWPAMFELAAKEIKSALGMACISVEHIDTWVVCKGYHRWFCA